MDELLTEEEAAAKAKVSRWTIRRLIERGKLKAMNYGAGRTRKYRIAPAAMLSVQLVDTTPKERTRKGRPPRRGTTQSGNVWPPKAA